MSGTPTPATRPVALVTGGTRGIGKAVLARLLRDGFDGAAVGVRPPAAVSGAMADLAGSAPEARVVYVQADIARAGDREALLAAVRKEFGRLDVLVNNAGVAPRVRADLLDTTEESFDRVLDVNLRGTFLLTQAAARWMVADREAGVALRPAIVNISSVSAYASSTSRGEYCIAKAGVSMVTSLFADRLAEHGIPVHEVRPGIIRTDMTGAVEKKYTRLIEGGLLPIRRWGTPEDVAEAVSVLASGRLSYSTGQVLDVDGGFHLRRL